MQMNYADSSQSLTLGPTERREKGKKNRCIILTSQDQIQTGFLGELRSGQNCVPVIDSLRAKTARADTDMRVLQKAKPRGRNLIARAVIFAWEGKV